MQKIHIPPTYLLLSVIIIVSFYFLFPLYQITSIFPWNLAGAIIGIAGFAIVARANKLFRGHKTTHTYNDPTSIITVGIFSKSRNPMYLGMFLFLTGLAVCLPNSLTLAIPFVFALIIHFIFIPYEEKKMERIFGNAFLEYKKSVRKWI